MYNCEYTNYDTEDDEANDDVIICGRNYDILKKNSSNNHTTEGCSNHVNMLEHKNEEQRKKCSNYSTNDILNNIALKEVECVEVTNKKIVDYT